MILLLIWGFFSVDEDYDQDQDQEQEQEQEYHGCNALDTSGVILL